MSSKLLFTDTSKGEMALGCVCVMHTASLNHSAGVMCARIKSRLGPQATSSDLYLNSNSNLK